MHKPASNEGVITHGVLSTWGDKKVRLRLCLLTPEPLFDIVNVRDCPDCIGVFLLRGEQRNF